MDYMLYQARSFPEAELLKQALLVSNLEAWVLDEHSGALYGQGFRVFVKEKDKEQALLCLNDFLSSNETIPPSSMVKEPQSKLLRAYRALICFLAISYYWASFRWFSRESIDPEILSIWLRSFHVKEIVDFFNGTVIILFLLKAVGYFGLYNFISWGRKLFIRVLSYELLVACFLGKAVLEGYELVWVEIQMMVIGIVLALSYSPPLKQYFSSGKKLPNPK